MSKQLEMLPYEIEICVGCGGVLFHAMSTMACEMNIREPKQHRMVFVDGDKIEPRNKSRQAWDQKKGAPKNKAVLAAQAWSQLEGGGKIQAVTLFVQDVKRLLAIIRPAIVDGVPDARLIVYAFVDTAVGRRACLDGVREAVREIDGIGEGWLVMAGNDLESGQCYGYKCDEQGWLHPGGALDNGEMQRITAARPEGHSQMDTHSCGAHVEQSLAGNMMTASCIARVLAELREGADTVEVFWQRPHFVGLACQVKMWTQTLLA